MGVIQCEYKPLQVEAIVLTTSNYRTVCEFINGFRPQMAESPAIPRGKYFGVFVETRYGRQLARIGDYIVKVGEKEYRAYTPEEFINTFKIRIQ